MDVVELTSDAASAPEPADWADADRPAADRAVDNGAVANRAARDGAADNGDADNGDADNGDGDVDDGDDGDVRKAAARNRAGRNLPVAIAVGLALAALITVPLYTVKPIFAIVVAAAIAVGTAEVAQALRRIGIHPPLVPLVGGGAVMLAAAYVRGADALAVGLLLTVPVMAAWLLLRRSGSSLRDLAGATFVIVYVPFLAGFATLLLTPSDGPRRVTAFIATVVCSDVGGLASGVIFGRHPLAPTISPNKTWEGFAGSAAACAIAGAIFLPTLFGGAVWQGVVYGLAVAGTATLGDLAESMIKRDIGIKDMGALLPGHGGLMDRLDSLLPTAPVAWLLLSAFAPPS